MKTFVVAVIVVVVVAVVAVVGAMRARLHAGRANRSGRRVQAPEAGVVVAFDASVITVRYPNGDTRRIGWDELTAVGVTTTDEGPFVADVFWGLHGPDGRPQAVYPGGATGEGELLAEMQRRLDGFDNARLIEAMGSTGNASFLLWQAGGVQAAA